jgi:hypothetical protein
MIDIEIATVVGIDDIRGSATDVRLNELGKV